MNSLANLIVHHKAVNEKLTSKPGFVTCFVPSLQFINLYYCICLLNPLLSFHRDHDTWLIEGGINKQNISVQTKNTCLTYFLYIVTCHSIACVLWLKISTINKAYMHVVFSTFSTHKMQQKLEQNKTCTA